MRHIWSLLAGVVAAPLAWLFLATGQHRSQRTVEVWDQAGRFDTAALVGPVIFLGVAGILLGVLGTLRWSPAGPVTAGVLLTLPTVFMFLNPFRTLDAFLLADRPRRVLGQDLEPWLPVENGTMLVLGALLLMAVFSAQRWRRWPDRAGPIPPATDQEVVAGISTLTGTETGTGTGTEGGGASQPAADQPAPASMTDDEILAAAAAFERTEGAGDSQAGRATGGTLEGGNATPGADPAPPPEQPGKDNP